MYLILADKGRREKKVKTLTGKSLLVKEDHLNLKAAALIKNILNMKGIEAELARDSAMDMTTEDYAEIVAHYQPDVEIFVTCKSTRKEGFKTLQLCNFNDIEGLTRATIDFELVDKINEFIDTL
jgi:N-acetylmuramoyl-L-alanine amidase